MPPGDAKTTNRPLPAAVILAAGKGERLLPWTLDRPKCLLEVGPVTILAFQIRRLREAGIQTIQVITGHGADRVRESLPDDILVAHNDGHETTGSLGSLGCTSVDISPGGLLVLNADVLFALSSLKRLLDSEGENALLAELGGELGEEEMKILVDDAGRVKSLSKTMDPERAHGENVGILRLAPALAGRVLALARAPENYPRLRWVPDALQESIEEFEIYAVATEDDPWIEIDFPHDLERARETIYPALA